MPSQAAKALDAANRDLLVIYMDNLQKLKRRLQQNRTQTGQIETSSPTPLLKNALPLGCLAGGRFYHNQLAKKTLYLTERIYRQQLVSRKALHTRPFHILFTGYDPFLHKLL